MDRTADLLFMTLKYRATTKGFLLDFYHFRKLLVLDMLAIIPHHLLKKYCIVSKDTKTMLY